MKIFTTDKLCSNLQGMLFLLKPHVLKLNAGGPICCDGSDQSAKSQSVIQPYLSSAACSLQTLLSRDPGRNRQSRDALRPALPPGARRAVPDAGIAPPTRISARAIPLGQLHRGAARADRTATQSRNCIVILTQSDLIEISRYTIYVHLALSEPNWRCYAYSLPFATMISPRCRWKWVC